MEAPQLDTLDQASWAAEKQGLPVQNMLYDRRGQFSMAEVIVRHDIQLNALSESERQAHFKANMVSLAGAMVALGYRQDVIAIE